MRNTVKKTTQTHFNPSSEVSWHRYYDQKNVIINNKKANIQTPVVRAAKGKPRIAAVPTSQESRQ